MEYTLHRKKVHGLIVTERMHNGQRYISSHPLEYDSDLEQCEIRLAEGEKVVAVVQNPDLFHCYAKFPGDPELLSLCYECPDEGNGFDWTTKILETLKGAKS